MSKVMTGKRFYVKHHVTEGDVKRVRESVQLPPAIVSRYMNASFSDSVKVDLDRTTEVKRTKE